MGYTYRVSPLSRPAVYSYENYRSFLRDYYHFLKASSPEFSYRSLSAKAGFGSPNFLKRVIDGDRNLTLSSIRKIIGALKLSVDEGSFFRRLVDLNQARNSGEKNAAIRELYKSEVFRELYPLKLAELEFYQCWYSIPIREMVAFEGFVEDPHWIASRIKPAITAQEAAQAIKRMLQLGFLSRDVSGKLVQSEANISTGREVFSAVVADFHRQMIALSAKSIENSPRHEREISGATILISKQKFAELKEMIQTFAQTLLAEAAILPSEDGMVYQINFQAFPLTEVLPAIVNDSLKKEAA